MMSLRVCVCIYMFCVLSKKFTVSVVRLKIKKIILKKTSSKGETNEAKTEKRISFDFLFMTTTCNEII